MSTTPAFDALEIAQQRFLTAYMANGQNGAAAYLHAYPDCSASSAPAAASRALSTVKVAAGLAELKGQLAERLKVTPQRIIGEYAAIAFARMGNFMAWGPTGVSLLPDDGLDDADQAAVSEVRETVTQHGGSIGLKLHDKTKALDKLVELFDITPALVKQLYPSLDLAAPEAVDGVIDIFKKAQERKREAEQGAAVAEAETRTAGAEHGRRGKGRGKA